MVNKKSYKELERRIKQLEEEQKTHAANSNQQQKAFILQIRKEEEQKYDAILNAIEDCFLEVDLEGNFKYFNSAFCNIVGYEPEEIKRENYFNFVDKKNKEKVFKTFQTIYKTREPVNRLRLEFIRKNGEVRYGEASISPIVNKENEVVGFRGLGRDITEQKKAEEAILQSKTEWEQTFDAVPDLIMILDKDYKIIRANKAMIERAGGIPEKTIGQTCYSLIHDKKEPSDTCPHRKLLIDGQEHCTEIFEQRLGGDFIVTVSPLLINNKERGSVHVARDITDRKLLEKEREKLITDLQRALDEVKTLHGLLPICASCKKIRGDNGYWNQIENYISEHSHVQFSHGICPDCIKKLYPDLNIE